MMHAAITRLARLPATRVSSAPTSGNIAALPRWNSIRHSPTAPSRQSSNVRHPAPAACWATSAAPPRTTASAASAGAISAAVSQNTAASPTYVPTAPITAAATPLPTAANRAFRPTRSPNPARPTSPRLTAAIAGPSMQLANPCSTSAPSTAARPGHAASNTALNATATHAAPAAARLFRSASTAAPPGTWLNIAASVPRLSAVPISRCVHASDARYTATNGPNPVCTLATSALNASRPRPGDSLKAWPEEPPPPPEGRPESRAACSPACP